MRSLPVGRLHPEPNDRFRAARATARSGERTFAGGWNSRSTRKLQQEVRIPMSGSEGCLREERKDRMARTYVAPDGSYHGAPPKQAPDGSYVAGTPTLAPNGKYVGGKPHLAPDGTYVGGKPHLTPHGKYVGGKPILAPNGQYVGDGSS